jgi:hypothetical protein
LRASPRKSFFEWLRRLSTDERERERLDEFVAEPVSGAVAVAAPSPPALGLLRAGFWGWRLLVASIR